MSTIRLKESVLRDLIRRTLIESDVQSTVQNNMLKMIANAPNEAERQKWQAKLDDYRSKMKKTGAVAVPNVPTPTPVSKPVPPAPSSSVTTTTVSDMSDPKEVIGVAAAQWITQNPYYLDSSGSSLKDQQAIKNAFMRVSDPINWDLIMSIKDMKKPWATKEMFAEMTKAINAVAMQGLIYFDYSKGPEPYRQQDPSGFDHGLESRVFQNILKLFNPGLSDKKKPDVFSAFVKGSAVAQRKAAEKIRDMYGDGPDSLQEIVKGLIKVGIDEADAEEIAFDIIEGTI